MKNIIHFLLVLLTATPVALGQRAVEEQFPATPGQAIEMEFNYATSIVVHMWDKPEVLVKGSATVNGGRDDQAYELSTLTQPDRIRIASRISDMKAIYRPELSRRDYYGRLPNGKGVQIGKGIIIAEAYEIYVPSQATLSVNSTYGSVTLDHNQGPLQVKTVYGDIEVRLPPTTTANITARTTAGSMYNELDEQPAKEGGLTRLTKQGDIFLRKGSGVSIRLQTDMGNVALRKK